MPAISPSEITQITKSLTAKQIFKRHPEAKQLLWGGHFWTSGFYLNTVGQHGNEAVIRQYVEEQGMEYKQIYRGQLRLL